MKNKIKKKLQYAMICSMSAVLLTGGMGTGAFAAEDNASDMSNENSESIYPGTENAVGDTVTIQIFEDYVNNILIPEKGMITRETLYSDAGAMSDITQWSESDVSGMISWKIMDFDVDGVDELLETEILEADRIAIVMYEINPDTMEVYYADSREFTLPFSLLKSYDFQACAFTYSSGSGQIIGIESHQDVMCSITSLNLFRYTGSAFEWLYSAGYHEQGQGDVYLYETSSEPAGDDGLDCSRGLYRLFPDVTTGWNVLDSYEMDANEWVSISKEDEKSRFYDAYAAMLENYGLKVNDIRLWVLQEPMDPEADYTAYHDAIAHYDTRDVYIDSEGTSVDILGGIHLMELIGSANELYVMY